MAKNKTEYTDEDVIAYIEKVENVQKKADSYRLIELMEEATGQPAKMYGPSIIGFGNYHYKYASGHEGEAPLLGFSPRKAAISLYVFTGADEHTYLLEGLGKFTMGKACIYIKKLDDIDEEKLIRMMTASINFISEKYNRLS
ncbi:protein of unknown function (DU1801) [Sphingobacterium nematocida]|uniref:YdhG-like domain-containing protein n=1 Tax=Sphingobacterium nematocida TaxID=1513896 RepID=A0A1T5C9M5_9SPHI|nr:DUF1801 domain-containing protein [Sphingobacterium nematocida]SKB55810.1 protein of unknown function (DU1801) [Sphingobacterium nematocida]